jgi:hypothetical protein
MFKATNYPYYSGSGIGNLGEDYDACSSPYPPAYCTGDTSWWDSNGGWIVTLIGNILTQWGTHLTQEQMNKQIMDTIKNTQPGGAAAPTDAQKLAMARTLAANMGWTEQRALDAINGTVGSGVPPKTEYPSWLLPAGIGLVAFILLSRRGGA